MTEPSPTLPLFDPEEHEPLTPTPWDPIRARAAIVSICEDAEQNFDPARFWPTHPHDADWDPGVPMVSLFWGASSNAWALLSLHEAGAITALRNDYREALRAAYRSYQTQSDADGPAPGYLFGECGILTALHRFAPDREIADRLYDQARATILRPELELMWAAPGAILAAKRMYEQTNDSRWIGLIREAAGHLIATWSRDPATGLWIWTQDLYGKSVQYLGAVHGFAGNVRALLEALPHLSADQRAQVLERSADTLARTAQLAPSVAGADTANWLPRIGAPDFLVQWCHGAPGMILSFAAYPAGITQSVDRLLIQGGELTFVAGPLKKPFGLCHGTAGNAYALLKLHRRTGDHRWLDRARRFATHALDQSDREYQALGRRRYGVLTGDLGLATLLEACLREDDGFPLVDYV